MGTFHVIRTKISGKSRLEREGLVVVRSSKVGLLDREGMSVNWLITLQKGSKGGGHGGRCHLCLVQAFPLFS